MSYIAPNSKIYFLKGVPLDPSYDHTVYWASASAQYNWFYSYRKPTASGIVYALEAQSYQRINKRIISCGICADNLYDCNYVMFQNTNFGAKWFYAFITSVEYVNNNVSNVTFEIDVMQTWFFDYELEDCFVEREHSSTDNPGDNLVPENFEIGDYIYTDAGNTFSNNVNNADFSICIAATWKRLFEIDGWSAVENAQPFYYNGVLSGLGYTVFNLSNATEMNKALTYLMDLSDKHKEEVVAIFMMPKDLCADGSVNARANGSGLYISRAKHTSWLNDDGTTYTPKNKKLLTYPYNMLYVTSSDGDSAIFKYEFFKTNTCEFCVQGAMGVPPEMGLTPLAYMTEAGGIVDNSFVLSSAANAGDSSLRINYAGVLTNLVGKNFVHNNKIYTVINAGTETIPDNITYTYAAILPHLKENLAAGAEFKQINSPNYNFTLFVKNFPMCSWISDSFRAWLAQNATRLVTTSALAIAGFNTAAMTNEASAGVISAGAALKSARIEGMKNGLVKGWINQAIADEEDALLNKNSASLGSNVISSLNTIANNLSQTTAAMLEPDHAHGVSKASFGMAVNNFGYHFYYARIRNEMAKIIDDFFDRFGYATKRNKKPNRTSRTKWNYVKTIACTINASIPSDDVTKICKIYDTGITFWHVSDGATVGDYSQINTIRSQT